MKFNSHASIINLRKSMRHIGMWATIWAAASALFTLLTGVIALWAMFRWKKQDELKARLNFKIAISHYATCLTSLPEYLGSGYIRKTHQNRCEELSTHFEECMTSKLVLEHLLDGEPEVLHAWDFIRQNHHRYFSGDLSKSDLGKECMVILNHHFVFN
ncbi:hypothetical protein [Pantoea hericii]|uniref:hypothetical protein n=1 Tax=Pantoea hericii TaxID=1815628 RepID=UPI0015FC9D34|nr:hypothetical protein [Pantoea hericii]